jgi:3-hydroxyisobutyrate dehydrogenase
MQNIGFIGLGAMGQPMARNLIEAGYAVRGYDLREEALRRLEADGGTAAPSPAAAAEGAQLLVVCVFTAAQAEAVLFGDQGALQTLPRGATVLMDTTMSPGQAQALEARLRESGHHLVDAPVTGGVTGADEGTLTFIVSGPADAVSAARPAMEVMGSKIALCGDHAGPASTVKMINQAMCGILVAAAAEGIALAAKAGADPKIVYEVIASGAARSFVWETRVADILARDYAPKGVVEIFTKDLAIALEGAREVSFPAPLTAAALQQFLAAAAMGHTRDNDAAVVRVYEALAGVDVAGEAQAKAGGAG